MIVQNKLVYVEVDLIKDRDLFKAKDVHCTVFEVYFFVKKFKKETLRTNQLQISIVGFVPSKVIKARIILLFKK